MYSDDHNASPVNPLPPVVVLFSLIIAGVELAMQALERGFARQVFGLRSRLEFLNEFAFYDPVVSWMLENGTYPADQLMRFVTYPFIHYNFGHALFAIVLVLAIGKMVGEAFSQTAFVIVFFASTLVGSLVYAALLDTKIPLVGAYPAAYGLIGALTFALWVRAKIEGTNPARAFSLIAFLMGIQLFFKLVFGGGNDWVADLAGFVTGFALSFVLAPDGGARMVQLLNLIRKRG